jgi:Domain of unknown function (DUF4157)
MRGQLLVRAARLNSGRDLELSGTLLSRRSSSQAPAHDLPGHLQPGSAAVGHHFARVPVHSRSGACLVDDPADRYEQEADQAAERAVNVKLPGDGPDGGRSPRAPGAVAAGSEPGPAAGRPLSPEIRAFFEPRFGHDFAGVRVHTSAAAADSADILRARAYTVGQDVTFARGGFRPQTRDGRILLAHELAHVMQQSGHRGRGASASPLSRLPGRGIQRKLVATGDTAGFAALANSVISVQFEVVVSAAGEVALRSSQVQGPPTREAQQMVADLQQVINDSRTTRVEFIRGKTSRVPDDAQVLIGSYAAGKIDLDDVSALGQGPGGTTAATALVHEIVEQYRKQVHGEAYPVAHRAGEMAEEAMTGATRGSHTLRQVDSATIEVTVPWTYPDGRVVDVIMTIVNGNVTGVTRRERNTR